MGITWELVEEITTIEFSIYLTHLFTTTNVAIEVTEIAPSPTRYKAGYIKQFCSDPALGNVYFAENHFIPLNRMTWLPLKKSVFPFQLHFEKVSWLNTITISVYQSNTALFFESTFSPQQQTIAAYTTGIL